MDFTNEHYVRLYTRDTTTMRRLGWDGRCVLFHVLRKLDLSGVLDIEGMEPWEAIVLHCDAPEEVAQRGMDLCLQLGVIVHNGHLLVAPNYRPAQEASKSDRQRQRESRARRRSAALEKTVTQRENLSRPVTSSHSTSSRTDPACPETCQSVTGGHKSSLFTVSVPVSVAVADASPNGKSHPSAQRAAAAAIRNSITGEEVAKAWNAAAHSFTLGVGHPHSHWRADYEVIAAACNAEYEREKIDPFQVLAALIGYFWDAPHGPIQTGRLKHPTPAILAKHLDRDLPDAGKWYLAEQRKAKAAREVAT